MSLSRSSIVFIAMSVVDTVLLLKLLTSHSSTDLLVAICIVTTLLFFSARFEDINEAQLGKEGLLIKLNDLGSRLNNAEHSLTDAQAEIEASKERVDNLFLLSMGPDMYRNLKKISEGNFGSYSKTANGGLDRELRHLRNIGYIEVIGNSISSIPEHGHNLSDYVTATQIGKQFVDLREAIERTKSQR